VTVSSLACHSEEPGEEESGLVEIQN